jgi:hypothetical protein
LQAALAAEPFAYEDLPPDLTERWRSADGQYRIEVFPRENLNDNQALRRFVTEVRAIAPEATGEPVILTPHGIACPSGLDPAPLPMSIFPKGFDLSSNALACAKHSHKPQLISNIGLKCLP